MSACPRAQFYPTVFNPMGCSLPDSFVHGIFQARIPERIFPTRILRLQHWQAYSLPLCHLGSPHQQGATHKKLWSAFNCLVNWFTGCVTLKSRLKFRLSEESGLVWENQVPPGREAMWTPRPLMRAGLEPNKFKGKSELHCSGQRTLPTFQSKGQEQGILLQRLQDFRQNKMKVSFFLTIYYVLEVILWEWSWKQYTTVSNIIIWNNFWYSPKVLMKEMSIHLFVYSTHVMSCQVLYLRNYT